MLFIPYFQSLACPSRPAFPAYQREGSASSGEGPVKPLFNPSSNAFRNVPNSNNSAVTDSDKSDNPVLSSSKTSKVSRVIASSLEYKSESVDSLLPLTEPVKSLEYLPTESHVILATKSPVGSIGILTRLFTVIVYSINLGYLFHSISRLRASLRSSSSSQIPKGHTPMSVEWHLPQ